MLGCIRGLKMEADSSVNAYIIQNTHVKVNNRYISFENKIFLSATGTDSVVSFS